MDGHRKVNPVATIFLLQTMDKSKLIYSISAAKFLSTMKTELYLTTFGKLKTAALRLARHNASRNAAAPVLILTPIQKAKPMTNAHFI